MVVISDIFSRWPEAFATRDHTASTIAKILFTNMVPRFGVPEVIHSDQGTEFMSDILSSLYSLLGIQRSRTTAYHPRGNGLVERLNQSLVDSLAKLADENVDWPALLPFVLFAYRSQTQSSLKVSPFEMLFGFQPRLPVDLILKLPILPSQRGSKLYKIYDHDYNELAVLQFTI